MQRGENVQLIDKDEVMKSLSITEECEDSVQRKYFAASHKSLWTLARRFVMLLRSTSRRKFHFTERNTLIPTDTKTVFTSHYPKQRIALQKIMSGIR